MFYASRLPALSVPSWLITRPELDDEGNTRPHFARDRDRILYSRPFRRLSGKTQVFLPYSHDYVRTRLTHTLEVAQIARDICEYLRFDVALAEAVAFGHDLGHTPFGHVGERGLNHLMNGCPIVGFNRPMSDEHSGFKHNLQSCKVAQTLSRLYSGKGGLNLTNFTYWGMANHTATTWGKCDCWERSKRCRLSLSPEACCNNSGQTSVGYYDKYVKMGKLPENLTTEQNRKNEKSQAWSFEGLVVRAADTIAQRHHDLEDALVTRIMEPKEVVEVLSSKFASLIADNAAYEQDRLYLKAMREFAD
ncbi:MAG: dNTP triphosphohydrolase, partial [Acidobacteria bacterium]|nr:dNTP triphosphohydrolase [Acidobacteriota bacterium]